MRILSEFPLASSIKHLDSSKHGINLFLVGFLVLFLELSCIRWFSTYVIFLQFFTNVVLIACFLGMSCGCLAARHSRNWLAYFPLIMLGSVVAAFTIYGLYNFWDGFTIDVGQQASPQEVFFGTEYRNPDFAKFAIPIEVIAGAFFILIASIFLGLGQVLGRAFDAYPDRIWGYTINIGGSVVGIIGFSVISFLHAPPVVWYSITSAGIVYLLYQDKSLTTSHVRLLVTLLAVMAVPLLFNPNYENHWSPYYNVVLEKNSGNITVNAIGHQQMVPYAKGGSAYSLIHLLEQQSGGEPFHDLLIIGAGSGNDIAHALRFGANRIDTVEIDPVIQNIGLHYHPDHPYQDPRVVPHLDDGRHFLRTTDRKFDLVEYALVDSLILHSSYANIRLESYLFTREAFEDIHRILKPDGLFVMYNYYRQGWIVERVSAIAKEVFGCEPLILSLPYRETLKSTDQAGFTMIIAGCNPRITSVFKQHDSFWLNDMPALNIGIDGFTIQPKSFSSDQAKAWKRIAPTILIHDEQAALERATDDWPFLYIRDRIIPDLSIRSMILLGVLGIGMVYFFLPKGRVQMDSRMFFLGAGFMLLETKAVVQIALLFGSTWLVNSAVFLTVLLLLLFANLYVLRVPSIRLSFHYLGLLLFLAATILVPFDVFLNGSVAWRYVMPCLLALGPMFFAGVIFAHSFRDASSPDYAFGSNIAGSVVGGLAESFSTVLGFRYLLLIAIGFYVLSALLPWLRAKKA